MSKRAFNFNERKNLRDIISKYERYRHNNFYYPSRTTDLNTDDIQIYSVKIGAILDEIGAHIAFDSASEVKHSIIKWGNILYPCYCYNGCFYTTNTDVMRELFNELLEYINDVR